MREERNRPGNAQDKCTTDVCSSTVMFVQFSRPTVKNRLPYTETHPRVHLVVAGKKETSLYKWD